MAGSEIRTPRLRLQPLQQGDLVSLHQHWTEPQVRRYLWDGHIISQEQVQEVIRTSEQLLQDHGVCLWAIRPLDSAELLGCGGYWHFHEPPQPELLLSITPERWGQGLATEAAVGVMDHAFSSLHWPFVQGSADAPNGASQRVMQRLGMQPCGAVPGEFGTIEIYRISREAWQAGKASHTRSG